MSEERPEDQAASSSESSDTGTVELERMDETWNTVMEDTRVSNTEEVPCCSSWNDDYARSREAIQRYNRKRMVNPTSPRHPEATHKRRRLEESQPGSSTTGASEPSENVPTEISIDQHIEESSSDSSNETTDVPTVGGTGGEPVDRDTIGSHMEEPVAQLLHTPPTSGGHQVEYQQQELQPTSLVGQSSGTEGTGEYRQLENPIEEPILSARYATAGSATPSTSSSPDRMEPEFMPRRFPTFEDLSSVDLSSLLTHPQRRNGGSDDSEEESSGGESPSFSLSFSSSGSSNEGIDVTESDSEQERCTICLSPLRRRDAIRVLPCSHCYHAVCMDRWMQLNMRCPICRRTIPPDSPPATGE